MRKLSSILTIFLVLCLTVGGVSAAWVYAGGAVVDIFKEIGITMPEWDFGYTVSFINNGELLLKNNPEYKDKNPIHWQPGTELVIMKNTGTGITNVLNDVAMYAAMEAAEEMGSGYIFSHWMNSGSTRVDVIPADNTENIILYPAFEGVYTAMFVDQAGNLFKKSDGSNAYATFTTTSASEVITLANTLAETIKASETDDTELKFDKWAIITVDDKGTPDDSTDDVVTETDLTEANLKAAKKDVTISPIYIYNGDAALIPIDSDGNGKTNYYQVGGFIDPEKPEAVVEIPAYVNGLPVKYINDNAFEQYADFHSVRIPATIEKIGAETFPGDAGWLGRNREVITIYYEGTPAQWATLIANSSTSWDEGMGAGTRVFFIGSDGKVIDGYYLELNVKSPVIGSETCTWVVHNHNYSHTAKCTSCNNSGTGELTNYLGNCGTNCNVCKGGPRPDQQFWPATTPPDNYWDDKKP